MRGGLSRKSGDGGGGKRIHLKIFRKKKPPWIISFSGINKYDAVGNGTTESRVWLRENIK